MKAVAVVVALAEMEVLLQPLDSTGGAGGGGFGGNGGDVTLSTSDSLGGGGGGGGGLGSRATIGTLTNLGNGGSDQNIGLDGNGYGLTITAGSGGGGNSGGNNAGGGGGGAGSHSGGGGGGSAGSNGMQPQGYIPPLQAAIRGSIHKREGKSVSEVLRELSVRASKSKEENIKPNETKLIKAYAHSKYTEEVPYLLEVMEEMVREAAEAELS